MFVDNDSDDGEMFDCGKIHLNVDISARPCSNLNIELSKSFKSKI